MTCSGDGPGCTSLMRIILTDLRITSNSSARRRRPEPSFGAPPQAEEPEDFAERSLQPLPRLRRPRATARGADAAGRSVSQARAEGRVQAGDGILVHRDDPRVDALLAEQAHAIVQGQVCGGVALA